MSAIIGMLTVLCLLLAVSLRRERERNRRLREDLSSSQGMVDLLEGLLDGHGTDGTGPAGDGEEDRP